MYRFLDVNVKIIRLHESIVDPDAPVSSYLLLKDSNGLLLKTADGFYLAVKKG